MTSPRCKATKADGHRCTRSAIGIGGVCAQHARTQHAKWRNRNGTKTLTNKLSPRLYQLTNKELAGLAERGVHIPHGELFTYPDTLAAKLVIQEKAQKRLKPSLKRGQKLAVRSKRSLIFDDATRAAWRLAADEAHARALKQLKQTDGEFDLAEIEFERHRQS